MRRRAAFTLAEVVVALVILEVGVLAVLSLAALAARELARAADVQRATGAAETVVDSLLTFDVRGSGQVDVGGHTVRWWRDGVAIRVEAKALGGGGEAIVRLELADP